MSAQAMRPNQIQWIRNEYGGKTATVRTKASGYVDLVVKKLSHKFSWSAYGWLGVELFVRRGAFESEKKARADAVAWWKQVSGDRTKTGPQDVPIDGALAADGIARLVAGSQALHGLTGAICAIRTPASDPDCSAVVKTIRSGYLIGAPDTLAQDYGELLDALTDAITAGDGDLRRAPAWHKGLLLQSLSATLEAATWTLSDALTAPDPGGSLDSRRQHQVSANGHQRLSPT